MKNNLILELKQPKRRRIWGFNPMTRVKPSKKIYSRKNYSIPNFEH